ncbi:MAG: hypothetical protein ABJ205_07660 [Erythrobacter sp.]|uniref:hypothetical protein n=1 Tax=Erythrobacter sp. TaxID=1042 RepID=UPI003264FC5C
MSNMNHAAFAQCGIQELSFDDIEMVGGAVDWGGVFEGAATAAAGVLLVTAGSAATAGTAGVASIPGGIAIAAGAVAIVAGGAQVIESAMKD